MKVLQALRDWRLQRHAALATIFFFIVSVAMAEVTPPDNLWKGLIGEAIGEGYEGMYAVCCVYKNRIEKEMSLGCVALKRRNLDEFVKREGRKAELTAKAIIEKIFNQNGIDVTRGATHYEAVERYGKPWWAKGMTVTVKIGEHTFYK